MATIELLEKPSAAVLGMAGLSTADSSHAAVAQVSPRASFLVTACAGLSADQVQGLPLEAQMQRAWHNLFAAMQSAGFAKHHLRHATMYVTVGGQCRLFRRVRDEMLQHLPVPSSCIQVEALEAGVGSVAIEGEAAL